MSDAEFEILDAVTAKWLKEVNKNLDQYGKTLWRPIRSAKLNSMVEMQIKCTQELIIALRKVVEYEQNGGTEYNNGFSVGL